MNIKAVDYCPHCCVDHVIGECPRDEETEPEYWAHMRRLAEPYERENMTDIVDRLRLSLPPRY